MTKEQMDNLPPEEIKNIQDYRIALLEKNYERLADKVDAGFKEVYKEISNVRVEMHGMLWKIPSIIIVAMTVLKWLSKYI
ncbi:hypothetical protein [Candidatus Liberibacter solanacearum]|uniref:hypothetical protein n=1 Tax=Candidatus Liberibacter solanacearum TaxID=556287 RepID=UPI00387DD191